MTDVTAGATLRFEPLGRSEYVLSENVPKVGDILKRNGDSWQVIEVTQEKDGTSTVILRPELKPADS